MVDEGTGWVERTMTMMTMTMRGARILLRLVRVPLPLFEVQSRGEEKEALRGIQLAQVQTASTYELSRHSRRV